MCIYTVKKKKQIKIKKFLKGVRDSNERLKTICTWLKESYQRKKTLYSTCM